MADGCSTQPGRAILVLVVIAAGAAILVGSTKLAFAQTTSTDVFGSCNVEASGYHNCSYVSYAQELGIGTVAGLVALSTGLGVAGLRYRYASQ